MIAIIPAFIRDAAGRRLLETTLDHLPHALVEHAIVVYQGDAPGSVPARQGMQVEFVPRGESMGKWAAIRLGFSRIDDAVARVLLIDADDPFEQASLHEFCGYDAHSDADLLIGRRDRIELASADSGPDVLRACVELFVDTLVTQQARARTGRPLAYADLQSGLYVLSPRARGALDLGYVEDYGGEVALYLETVAAGLTLHEWPIVAHHQSSSNYTVDAVCEALVTLPPLAATSQADLLAARRDAMTAYGQYLQSIPKRVFEHAVERYAVAWRAHQARR